MYRVLGAIMWDIRGIRGCQGCIRELAGTLGTQGPEGLKRASGVLGAARMCRGYWGH